jgi:hypothetical protein
MQLVKNIHSMEEKISISRVVIHDGIRDINLIFLQETFMLMQGIVSYSPKGMIYFFNLNKYGLKVIDTKE